MIDSNNVLKLPTVSFLTPCGRFDFTIYAPNDRVDFSKVRDTLRVYWCRTLATMRIKPEWDNEHKCSIFRLETQPITLVEVFKAFETFKANGWIIYPYWESMRIYATIEKKTLNK